MSHNTPLANAEFQLAFTETNLRWLLGETPQDAEKIARTRQAIAEAEALIERLKSDVTPRTAQPLNPERP